MKTLGRESGWTFEAEGSNAGSAPVFFLYSSSNSGNDSLFKCEWGRNGDLLTVLGDRIRECLCEGKRFKLYHVDLDGRVSITGKYRHI